FVCVSGVYSGEIVGGVFVTKRLLQPNIRIIKTFDDLSLGEQVLFHPVLFLKIELQAFRKHLEDIIYALFDRKSGALLAGMLLGSKDGFDKEYTERLRQSGLLHLVVASGGNIVLVSSMILFLMGKRFKRSWVF